MDLVSKVTTKMENSEKCPRFLGCELTPLFLHRSQHGECLHVPGRDHWRAGGPSGPSGAHRQPSLLILPAHSYAGLSGRRARLLPCPDRPVGCPALSHHTLPQQNVASQAPQSLPAISQPPQSSSMGYMGSQAVSMGYQPYGMQVRLHWVSAQGRGLGGLGRPF